MNYTSPLNIFVVWHPDYTNGKLIFEQFYSSFCRDTRYPLNRSLGIPVFERSSPAINSALPLFIDINESDHTAIILLVDDEMFNDASWAQYLESIVPQVENVRLYPIAISKYAHKVHHKIAEIQFINLPFSSSDETVIRSLNVDFSNLISRLSHEFSRQLLGLKASYEANNYEGGAAPVKLFISHAKWDGETIAKEFRDYIRSETKLASFFDANDIPDGSYFSEEIERNLNGNSVLVVFQTDAYTSREWCRKEIIIAKRRKIPIVVVNAVEDVERRSFPYLGNVPVLRWKNNFNLIVLQSLRQILYQLFAEAILEKYKANFLQGHNDIEYIASSPELFNYIDIVRLQKEKGMKKLVVLYPDPPLGIEEIELLNDIDDNVMFVTPISLSPQMRSI